MLYPENSVILNERTFARMSSLINALPRKFVILNGRKICRNVYFNQRFTAKTRDIKWTRINLMSTLINALPRKLVILNGCTFA